jgi:hypothetical protein
LAEWAGRPTTIAAGFVETRTMLRDQMTVSRTLHFLGTHIDFDATALNDCRLNWLIAELQRPHAESKRKSELSSYNWRRKQKLAAGEWRVLTAACPG